MLRSESTTRGLPVTAPSGTVTSTTSSAVLSGAVFTRFSSSLENFTVFTCSRPEPVSSTFEPIAAALPSQSLTQLTPSSSGSVDCASAAAEKMRPAPKLAIATIAATSTSLVENWSTPRIDPRTSSSLSSAYGVS